MKRWLMPFISLSVAAAFAATQAFSNPRPASTLLIQDEKPPEKPAKPQDPKPPEKPGNPPAKPAPNHEPDRKPDNKPPEKPAKPDHNPPQQQNPPEKPAKPENAPKQQKQQNDKMSKNSGDQNKKSVHAQANVHYSFRSDDKPKLRQHFDVQIHSVDRAHRVRIREGAFIPSESVTLIETVPVDIITLIPPVPEGCVVGFWDGYIIVYYPDDFYIVSYIDLL